MLASSSRTIPTVKERRENEGPPITAVRFVCVGTNGRPRPLGFPGFDAVSLIPLALVCCSGNKQKNVRASSLLEVCVPFYSISRQPTLG